ncbi:RHS repeat-associated core domain-containing protein, partial [bacterium]|nr:RHS repeat-associated core domain-containing protein [bacterium]
MDTISFLGATMAPSACGACRRLRRRNRGSVRLTLDEAGVPVDPSGYSYTPFGVPQSGAIAEPFGFTGEVHSIETGLVYLRARWYDPASGTFLSRDPFAGYPTIPT